MDSQEYDVRRKSNGQVVYGPVFVSSTSQAVGYYVACVLKERYKYSKFYATPTIKQVPKSQKVSKPVVIVGACPSCGYLDPQRDQASHCPNCDARSESIGSRFFCPKKIFLL